MVSYIFYCLNCELFKSVFKKKQVMGKCGSTMVYDFGTYYGSVLNGKKHGYGKLTFRGGNSWKGEWKYDKPFNGKGVYEYENGDIYHGKFLNGEKHGHGIMAYDYKGGCMYEGEWLKDKRHGQGTFFSESGRLWTGQWENGRRKR